jgi:putative transcriptional regulator
MSRILDEMYETAKDLHGAGLFSDEQLRQFDVLCIPKTPLYSADAIRELRIRNHLNQNSLAALLNISASTLQKWETGAKKPVGAARKLLHILETKGLSSLL